MKTLITVLALACATSNTLLFADWILRREFLLGVTAGGMALFCAAVACFVHRLRF
jgi:hypothetical protein